MFRFLSFCSLLFVCHFFSSTLSLMPSFLLKPLLFINPFRRFLLLSVSYSFLPVILCIFFGASITKSPGLSFAKLQSAAGNSKLKKEMPLPLKKIGLLCMYSLWNAVLILSGSLIYDNICTHS